MSLQSKGLSRVFSNTTFPKHQFFDAQPSLWSRSHIHTWLLKKTMALTMQTFVGKVMSLLFDMLSRFVIAFLPRSKCLLISWLHLPSAVILEPKKIKSVTVSIVSPSIYHELMGLENWCFCTVVLEKTLKSPWDCKEIKPVHPKGNQSWMFIGRTDVEAEMTILWPPDAKN